MATLTRVTVLCPNGRRQTVNLTSNSSILQILEEVCQKQNLNADDFDICHYNKPVDLSLPARFANLSNNAQLELQPAKTVRKDCLVTVGLQLESGERIMKDFVPSTSVWDVVEQCLNTKPDKTNSKENEVPVCIYMRQKLVGNALRETTLRGLGLTKGSAIIRLLYRNPDDLSEQAHISTSLSKPVKDTSTTYSATASSSTSNEMECDPPVDKQKMYSGLKNDQKNLNDAPSVPHKQVQSSSFVSENRELSNPDVTLHEKKKNENFLSRIIPSRETKATSDSHILNKTNENMSNFLQEQKMELDSVSMDQESSENTEEIGAIHYIGGRHAVLYSLDDITDAKKADLPDEFFDLTVDDVKYLMEEFKKARVDMENQPLLTKELRNRQILQKLGRFKQTVIRVYFPERYVLQAVFEAQETVQDVCDFIRNYLEDKSLNFYLYTTPPKEKKDSFKTLIESMLIPAAVVYFGCDKFSSNYLMETLKGKVSDPRAASLAAYESRKQAIIEIEEEMTKEQQLDEMTNNLVQPDVAEYKVPGPCFSQASSSSQATEEKVPKWLKLSKK